jgi:RNA polymerase sigma-70 factor (ECF subfamily)
VSDESRLRLARAKGGDSQAFEELLTPVLEVGFRLAMTMLNDRGMAEDAVQEAALKAWRNLGRLRPEAPLRPWFLTVVANECRSARRSRWWRVLRFPELGGPRQASSRLEDRIDLTAALDRLPQRHLLPLSLYYHLDLPIAEVARVLGCSEGAARLRIHRALAALRPAMKLEEADA